MWSYHGFFSFVFLDIFRDVARNDLASELITWLNCEISSSIDAWFSELKESNNLWTLGLDNVLRNLSFESAFHRNFLKFFWVGAALHSGCLGTLSFKLPCESGRELILDW